MPQVQYNAEFEGRFYHHLRKLVSMRTCFWEDDSLGKAVACCYKAAGNLASGWVKEIDEHGNLLIYSTGYNLSKPLLYISSHIDTVGADEKDWLYPPFEATESTDYIIGRGVNDCKAGTAFQLALLDMLNKYQLLPNCNIGFMVMYREEGNQEKTSSFVDFNQLPVSKAGTYFMTLENTVSVINEQSFEIAVYNREPHNLFIEITDTLKGFTNILDDLLGFGWRPVVVLPVAQLPLGLPISIIRNEQSGHSATQCNQALLRLLKSPLPENYLIKCGDEAQSSVIGAEVYIYQGMDNSTHRFILNYRGFASIAQIQTYLLKFTYREFYSFSYGKGSDQSKQFSDAPFLSDLFSGSGDDITVKTEGNPGRSDASAVYNSLTQENKNHIIPFACGPGCRTHTDKNNIRHATHGENEGFFIPSAKKSLPFLLNLINKFKTT